MSSMVVFLLFFTLPMIDRGVSAPEIWAYEPVIASLNGSKLDTVNVGEQVIITSTFTNNRDDERAFFGWVEIRNATGFTLYISWQSGILEAPGNATFGVSWLVQAPPGDYEAREFAITDSEQPLLLSYVKSTNFIIR